eukprot:8969490-Pyramimonas_sp.AAC.1
MSKTKSLDDAFTSTKLFQEVSVLSPVRSDEPARESQQDTGELACCEDMATQEDPTQEDLKQEDLKQEDLKQEDLKQEDLTQEDLKQEDLAEEHLKQEVEELRQVVQELKQVVVDLMVEDPNQEDPNQEDLKQEVLTQEQVEDLKQARTLRSVNISTFKCQYVRSNTPVTLRVHNCSQTGGSHEHSHSVLMT